MREMKLRKIVDLNGIVAVAVDLVDCDDDVDDDVAMDDVAMDDAEIDGADKVDLMVD